MLPLTPNTHIANPTTNTRTGIPIADIKMTASLFACLLACASRNYIVLKISQKINSAIHSCLKENGIHFLLE